jgi:hypothetical protein
MIRGGGARDRARVTRSEQYQEMKGKEGGDLLPVANSGARYVQESKRSNGNIKHKEREI